MDRRIRWAQLAVAIPLILLALCVLLLLYFWATPEAQEIMRGFYFGSPKFLLVVAIIIAVTFIITAWPWRR